MSTPKISRSSKQDERLTANATTTGSKKDYSTSPLRSRKNKDKVEVLQDNVDAPMNLVTTIRTGERLTSRNSKTAS